MALNISISFISPRIELGPSWINSFFLFQSISHISFPNSFLIEEFYFKKRISTTIFFLLFSWTMFYFFFLYKWKLVRWAVSKTRSPENILEKLLFFPQRSRERWDEIRQPSTNRNVTISRWGRAQLYRQTSLCILQPCSPNINPVSSTFRFSFVRMLTTSWGCHHRCDSSLKRERERESQL